MGHRWRSIELNSHELVLYRRASWLYGLMELASSIKESSGRSPFEYVQHLDLNLVRLLPRSYIWANAVMCIDVASLPICQLFPNISTLSLRLYGKAQAMDTLYQNLALNQLTTLQLSVSTGDPIVLQDLLSQLPALKHLDGWGPIPDPCQPPFIHTALESFTTRDARFHTRCSSLSFPSLQHLSLGITQMEAPSSSSVMLPLTSMLSASQLRVLKLDNRPLTEPHLVQLLVGVPTLDTLILSAPFNASWKDTTGHVFSSLTERSKTTTTLPMLKEIVMHTIGKVPSEENKSPGADVEYRGFCALRDSFIQFVENPRRWDLLPLSDFAQSGAAGLVYRCLDAARFDHDGGVIYHRVKDRARSSYVD
ncbi:hypothetical protein BKA70DRAFT_1231673 [Coprinopsis sp. MPI-PUGE-AT-0042]|nr:hypothetical protein BKA70DRAFT_1231673 [Coprinopsis sp. MPI-PUGE-AT-0042]